MTLTVPVSDRDHDAGPDTAPITLVEYGDYECPHCGAAYPMVKELQRVLGDRLRFVFRNFPLTQIHPHAEHAAESAEAAGAQDRFWEMHDWLFEHQRHLADAQLVTRGRDARPRYRAVSARARRCRASGACARGLHERRAQRRQRDAHVFHQRTASRRFLGQRHPARRSRGG